MIKRALGWPKHLEREPSRVYALKAQIKELKLHVSKLEEQARVLREVMVNNPRFRIL